jgi:hypothetical protein
MAAFETEVVDGKSPYTDVKLGDQENGFTTTFYYDNKTKATSQDYGEFEILQGVKFDHTLDSTDDMLAGATLSSMIPNTMLKNLINNGGMVRGEAYIVTKKWTKGDKFNNKKALGHGYEVQRIKAPDAFLAELKKRHSELLPEGMGTETVNVDTPEVDI